MMKRLFYLFLAGMALSALGLLPLRAQSKPESREAVGQLTNGPIVFDLYRNLSTIVSTQLVRLPPHLITNASLATNPVITRLRTNTFAYTNLTFADFAPGSLAQLVWTNFIAHTNGRDLRIWSERTHPPDFPTNPPTAKWNHNSLIWGMRGLTALSPSWAAQGAPGQIPLTALTRRHVYTRGHGMGADGFSMGFAGKKAWFLTKDDKLIEVKVKRTVVRINPPADKSHQDYTILLLDRDLPPEIEPIAVTSMDNVRSNYLFSLSNPFPISGAVPMPLFQTEQAGYVSSGVPPLTVNAWKGGDSGSPNLIPLLGELIFFGGRSTSGPTAQMQADMDELCRLEGLDPRKYQMRWVDLGQVPRR